MIEKRQPVDRNKNRFAQGNREFYVEVAVRQATPCNIQVFRQRTFTRMIYRLSAQLTTPAKLRP